MEEEKKKFVDLSKFPSDIRIRQLKIPKGGDPNTVLVKKSEHIYKFTKLYTTLQEFSLNIQSSILVEATGMMNGDQNLIISFSLGCLVKMEISVIKE